MNTFKHPSFSESLSSPFPLTSLSLPSHFPLSYLLLFPLSLSLLFLNYFHLLLSSISIFSLSSLSCSSPSLNSITILYRQSLPPHSVICLCPTPCVCSVSSSSIPLGMSYTILNNYQMDVIFSIFLIRLRQWRT